VSSGLLNLDNVVLTPHIASATRNTREAMGLLAVEALRAVLLHGSRPPNAVDT
jgi:lactate dehydrogenase-like 2-hydroxyacid dehydrogenase